MKKSSFQYGMKISIENEMFIPGPSLTAEKQDPGLKFSIENEIFKPRMKFSSEIENFVRGGMVFFMRPSENEFFRSWGPLGNQNKRDVHKISARNSGAGNGCADFMGAWHFWVLSAGKAPMPIRFLLLGRGHGCFWKGGGVEVPILFLWAWGFFRNKEPNNSICARIAVRIVQKVPVRNS